jgi:mono/diheme cytochrome c family protein
MLLLLMVPACRQQMADQPSYRPLGASSFFADGRSARPRIAGTVARGELDDEEFSAGESAAVFPVPVTEELLAHGRERFDIYCSVCHGLLGDGDGMVVRRGFPAPPSLHSDRLRAAPPGYLYRVASRGIGAMPRYETVTSSRDRWAIVAYMRALQLSQHARASELPAEDRARLIEEGR